jgi:hypothetical protein
VRNVMQSETELWKLVMNANEEAGACSLKLDFLHLEERRGNMQNTDIIVLVINRRAEHRFRRALGSLSRALDVCAWCMSLCLSTKRRTLCFGIVWR